MPQIHSIELTAIVLRLLTAAAAGGIIGYGRSKRNRAAGLRTYMLISMASALTMLMGSYDYEMLMTGWSDAVAAVGMKYDGARYASSVISGMVFLRPARLSPPNTSGSTVSPLPSVCLLQRQWVWRPVRVCIPWLP